MKYYENIVVTSTSLDVFSLLTNGTSIDWKNEIEKTFMTTERFLPRLLVEMGLARSTSEIKRNRQDLWIELPYNQYNEIKYGKHKIFIVS